MTTEKVQAEPTPEENKSDTISVGAPVTVLKNNQYRDLHINAIYSNMSKRTVQQHNTTIVQIETDQFYDFENDREYTTIWYLTASGLFVKRENLVILNNAT